MMCEENERPC
jgi:hypothetical protein